jgi:hypothetical protein
VLLVLERCLPWLTPPLWVYLCWVFTRNPTERRRASLQLPDDAMFLAAPLHLTELQIEDILRAPCAASPVFLRRLIDSLKLAQFDGMPVSVMLDRCLNAGSIRDLIQRLLGLFTRGWSPAYSEYQPPSSPVAGARDEEPSRPTIITRPRGVPVPGVSLCVVASSPFGNHCNDWTACRLGTLLGCCAQLRVCLACGFVMR